MLSPEGGSMSGPVWSWSEELGRKTQGCGGFTTLALDSTTET